jgi:hypothetical protein
VGAASLCLFCKGCVFFRGSDLQVRHHARPQPAHLRRGVSRAALLAQAKSTRLKSGLNPPAGANLRILFPTQSYEYYFRIITNCPLCAFMLAFVVFRSRRQTDRGRRMKSIATPPQQKSLQVLALSTTSQKSIATKSHPFEFFGHLPRGVAPTKRSPDSIPNRYSRIIETQLTPVLSPRDPFLIGTICLSVEDRHPEPEHRKGEGSFRVKSKARGGSFERKGGDGFQGLMIQTLTITMPITQSQFDQARHRAFNLQEFRAILRATCPAPLRSA